MSKKLSSTLLLFAIAIGFSIYSVYLFIHIKHADDVVMACLYAIPAVAAFVALILLPFKQE